MLYKSTRGGEKNVKFIDCVLKGLADDGGLFVPQEFPKVSLEQFVRWKDLSYAELAFEVLFTIY